MLYPRSKIIEPMMWVEDIGQLAQYGICSWSAYMTVVSRYFQWMFCVIAYVIHWRVIYINVFYSVSFSLAVSTSWARLPVAPPAGMSFFLLHIIIYQHTHTWSYSTTAKATPASPSKGRKRAVVLIPETPPRGTRSLPGLSVRKFLELEAKYPYMTEYVCHIKITSTYTDFISRAEYEETVTSLKKTPVKNSSPCVSNVLFVSSVLYVLV